MKSLELLTGASFLSARFRTILDLFPDLRPFLSPGKGPVADRADLRWQMWFLVRHVTSAESEASQLEIRLETLRSISAVADPDNVILLWIEQEEILFRTLERHIVANRLVQGFDDDVDMFVDFSLSVQNRRKCRAGYALENYLEAVFQDHQLRYSREKVTENRTKPDFVFPSIEAYHDATFPSEDLTMLGVKQTCKDRWRQVLSEASRIGRKRPPGPRADKCFREYSRTNQNTGSQQFCESSKPASDHLLNIHTSAGFEAPMSGWF